VLVVVIVRHVHLADTPIPVISLHLRKHANLQAPIARDAEVRQHLRAEGKLPGQGIAEAVEVSEEGALPVHFPQGPKEGGDEEATDPTPELSSGDPGVVPLTEIVLEARVHYGVEEARQQGAIVGQDVAIVQRDRIHEPSGLHVAEAIPNVPALAELPGCEA
jgi:hypothetical protein